MTTKYNGARLRKELGLLSPQGQVRVWTNFEKTQVSQYSTSLMGMMGAMMGSAISESLIQAIQKLVTYIDTGIIKENDIGLGNAMYRAGEVARQATYDAYIKSVANKVAPYRVGNNRLSGMLGEVLKSPAFVASSATGVSFGNLALLDAEAKHWARLNYGAGAKGGVGASGGFHDSILESASNPTGFQPSQTEFRGHTYGAGEIYKRFQSAAQTELGSFHLNPGPRIAFTIPKGFWFGAGGNQVLTPRFTGGPSKDQFFPFNAASKHAALYSLGHNSQNPYRLSKNENFTLRPYIQAKTLTAGIAPHRFLDVGLRVLYGAVGQSIEGYVSRVENLKITQNIGAEAKRIQGGIEVYSVAEVRQVTG